MANKQSTHQPAQVQKPQASAAAKDSSQAQATPLAIPAFPQVGWSGLPQHVTTRPQRQAHILQMQRHQGNAFVQRQMGGQNSPLLPQASASTVLPTQSAPTERVQRETQAPSALVKIPYSYNWETKTDIGKFVKITKVNFKIEGSLTEMPPAGQQTQLSGTAGTPTVSVGGQSDSKDSKKDAAAISIERKRQTDDWFSQKMASLHPSIKPYEKESAGFKKSDKDVQGKVAYEGGVDISPFIFDGGKANFAAEFNVLNMKKEPGKKPEFSFLTVVPKASVGGVAKNFPVDGFLADLKGEVAVTFEPDYVALAQLALECPATWVFALAAGGAALIYFSYKDYDRRAKLFHGVKAQANSLAKAGATYAGAVTGDTTSPSGKNEKDAYNKGRADLAKVLADNNLTEDEFRGMLKDQKLNAQFFTRASADYVDQAMGLFEVKVRDEIKAWHSEHYVQSFFSGNYASDDIAIAESIVDGAKASGGNPTIG
jgi:hypothetical protein